VEKEKRFYVMAIRYIWIPVSNESCMLYITWNSARVTETYEQGCM